MHLAIAVTAALLALDRVLKGLARREKLHFSGKLLRLTHLENPGFFMGVGSRYQAVLRWVPLLIWIAAAVLLLPHVERRLNPEKQGSIYDLHFQKKWMGSCDEAEQRQMGQAAMRAFRTVNTVCPFIWCVLMMLDFVFHFGALPAFTVLLTWGVLNVSYMLEAIRLSRRA